MSKFCLAFAFFAAAACHSPEKFEAFSEGPYVPPGESCEAPNVTAPTRFAPCSEGGGIFGSWDLDMYGLPAYEYGLDQNADARASFANSEGRDRRDHWFAIGNDRLSVLAFNDGYVEVTTQDRGLSYLNKFDEKQGNFAGGFGYLDDGEETWSTAYKWRPEGSRTARRFGMGYAESELTYRGIRAVRRVVSPPGLAPVVIAEVELENTSRSPRTLRHYEYWDVARRPMETNWVVSGVLTPDVPATAAKARDARNQMFNEQVQWDPLSRTVGVRRQLVEGQTSPLPFSPSEVDYYPGDPFLTVLRGDVSDLFTEQAAFFGEGGVAHPSALVGRMVGDGVLPGAKGRTRNGINQPRAFVVRSDISLQPGETTTLRFAYGYAPIGEPFIADRAWGNPSLDVRKSVVDAVRPKLLYFATEQHPFLQRELAWHSYQLGVAAAYRDYWSQRVVPQGSAYLYLHGMDGAPRDLALVTIPLVYTDPALARDQVTMQMKTTHAEGLRISYAYQGHGMLDDALGFHSKPSDLPIFFLWSLTEYVGATGDLSVLDGNVPFWPLEARPTATGWDHLEGAVRHLFDTIGFGAHGLIRLQSGDWSDGVVLWAPDRALAIKDGESIPNSQMALFVLPRVAALVEARNPALAQEIRAKLPGLCEAVRKTWGSEYFGRVYYGDGILRGLDSPNLEAQVWALQSDCFREDGDRERLVQMIATRIDGPSPTGAPLWEQTQVWHAISGLLTWGYAQSHPELAFNHLARDTMTAHAKAFPETWYGIWSGPDATDGVAQKTGGVTWASPVTPMTDFPVQNSNQHGMPMLAALKVAGLEAMPHGLRIRPAVPGKKFSLRTQLVDLEQRPGVLSGTYRPQSVRQVEIHAPIGQRITGLKVNGLSVPVPEDASVATFEASQPNGTSFELNSAPRERSVR